MQTRRFIGSIPVRAGAALVAALALLIVSTPRQAAGQRPHVGVRIGYDFEVDNPLIGPSFSIPLTSRIDFVPSIDVYLPDHGSMVGFNGDFKVKFPMVEGPAFYLGGGAGVISAKSNGDSDTDFGVNLFMGLDWMSSGWVHPFVETRVAIRDRNAFQLLGGINFTIGGQ